MSSCPAYLQLMRSFVTSQPCSTSSSSSSSSRSVLWAFEESDGDEDVKVGDGDGDDGDEIESESESDVDDDMNQINDDGERCQRKKDGAAHHISDIELKRKVLRETFLERDWNCPTSCQLSKQCADSNSFTIIFPLDVCMISTRIIPQVCAPLHLFCSI